MDAQRWGGSHLVTHGVVGPLTCYPLGHKRWWFSVLWEFSRPKERPSHTLTGTSRFLVQARTFNPLATTTCHLTGPWPSRVLTPSGVSVGGCEGALSEVPRRRRAVPAGLALRAVEAAQEAGVGGCGGPGTGPRPRPALAVLPRSSPMLIFGLGRPCPGISRHASRRPVCRPEPGGRRESDSSGCSSSPECAADPPALSHTLPRSLPGYGRGHRAAR